MLNNYSYQYETSPRKIEPNYSKSKKRTSSIKRKNKSIRTKMKNINKNTDKCSENKKTKNEIKQEKLKYFKIKCSIAFKTVLIFGAFFFVVFREEHVIELFSDIQMLK